MNKSLKIGSILLLITVVSACKKDEAPAPPVEYDKAKLLTKNYITDDGSLDFLMDELKITEGVAYAFGASLNLNG